MPRWRRLGFRGQALPLGIAATRGAVGSMGRRWQRQSRGESEVSPMALNRPLPERPWGGSGNGTGKCQWPEGCNGRAQRLPCQDMRGSTTHILRSALWKLPPYSHDYARGLPIAPEMRTSRLWHIHAVSGEDAIIRRPMMMGHNSLAPLGAISAWPHREPYFQKFVCGKSRSDWTKNQPQQLMPSRLAPLVRTTCIAGQRLRSPPSRCASLRAPAMRGHRRLVRPCPRRCLAR